MPFRNAKLAWRTFLAQCFLTKMPSVIQTKGRATPNRLDLQLHAPLGAWTNSPCTRQRFGVIIVDGTRFFWRDSSYRSNDGRVFNAEDTPFNSYPWEAYDGRKKNDVRWPPIPKHGVTYNTLKWTATEEIPNLDNLLQSSRKETWMSDLIESVTPLEENWKNKLRTNTTSSDASSTSTPRANLTSPSIHGPAATHSIASPV